MNYEEIVEDILERAVEDLNMQLESEDKLVYAQDLPLIGKACSIDSMDRTVLIVFIETELEEKTGKFLSIMEDEIFSKQDETNPLSSVAKLKEYIIQKLGE